MQFLRSKSAARAVIASCPLTELCFHCSSAASNSGLSSASTRLYSLRTHHKKQISRGDKAQCRALELEAWRFLQQVPDSDVDNGSVVDLSELMASWVYFSKHWTNGMNGPLIHSNEVEPKAMEELDVPVVTRKLSASKPAPECTALPPRSNPLDEVLDF